MCKGNHFSLVILASVHLIKHLTFSRFKIILADETDTKAPVLTWLVTSMLILLVEVTVAGLATRQVTG